VAEKACQAEFVCQGLKIKEIFKPSSLIPPSLGYGTTVQPLFALRCKEITVLKKEKVY